MRPEPYPEARALPHYLRLVEHHFVYFGRDEPVTEFVCGFQSRRDPVVFDLRAREFLKTAHKIRLIRYIAPAFTADHRIENLLVRLKTVSHASVAKRHALQYGLFKIGKSRKRFESRPEIAHLSDAGKLLSQGARCFGHKRVLRPERRDPARQLYEELPHGEVEEQVFKQRVCIRSGHLKHVHSERLHAEALFYIRRGGLRSFGAGIGAVHYDGEWLACFFELGKELFFRGGVCLACKSHYAPVRQHRDADRRMLGNDLSSAYLGRFLKRNIAVEPGSPHHAGDILLGGSQSAFRHKAHAVYHAD